MAIGDNTNPNLFGTNYNPEDEALLAAQNARIGAGNVPASAFGQAPAVNSFSMEAAGQVNPMMQPQSLEVPPQAPAEPTLAPQMTGLRPVNPQSGEFFSQDVIAAGEGAGLTFPSQVSLPMPQAPQAPQVQAPMGQKETRAALGGMTLNEYLNAPAGTEGVSGLRTDPQGRMVPNIGQFQEQPEVAQPPVDSAVPPATARPPVDALSSFEKDSLARQQRIGGTGSFEGDSDARDARVRASDRQPGESQADRDTRAAQSRTTGGQTEGLSFDDAKRRAEGQLAERGVRNPSVSQVNALARGIQAGEPERLEALETKRAKDAADLGQANTKMGFEPRVIDVGGERAMELSPGYFQRIAKDTPNKTGLQATLDNLQDDLKSGRLTQEQHDIAVGNATNIYIGLKEPKQNEIDAANEIAKLKEKAMGTTPAEGDELPDSLKNSNPSQFTGQTIQDKAGNRYTSDGTKWTKI